MIPLTAEALAALRSRTDPLADAAVAALTGKGGPGDSVLERVRAGAGSHPALAAFVEATSRAPAWADFGAMEAGRAAAMRSAPLTFLVLLTASLIESFAAAPGAKVLSRTGRLERDTVPRLYETAAMLRDLLLPGGALPGQAGHTALLRVRLLHAYVRRFIRKTPQFDPKTWGEPINQADMVHTLMMFSIVVARGVETLGMRFTDEERRSWCHLWRYAGLMLGVEEAVLFASVADEEALYALLRAHHYGPDETSRALATAVIDALSGEPPFFLPKPMLQAISRRLLGEPLADQFHLPRSRRWAASVQALAVGSRGLDTFVRRAPLGKRASLAGGHAFVEFHRWRVLRQGPLAAYVFRTSR